MIRRKSLRLKKLAALTGLIITGMVYFTNRMRLRRLL